MVNVEKLTGRPMNGTAEGTQAVVIRLDGMPATPGNLKRIGERVLAWNQRLAECGLPFRLRMQSEPRETTAAAGSTG